MWGVIMSLPVPINWMQKPSESKLVFQWKWSQGNRTVQMQSGFYFYADSVEEARAEIEFWVGGLNRGYSDFGWRDFGSGRHRSQLLFCLDEMPEENPTTSVSGYIGSLVCISEVIVPESESIGPAMRGNNRLTPEEEAWYLSQVPDAEPQTPEPPTRQRRILVPVPPPPPGYDDDFPPAASQA
jgi:hypothetical protein